MIIVKIPNTPCLKYPRLGGKIYKNILDIMIHTRLLLQLNIIIKTVGRGLLNCSHLLDIHNLVNLRNIKNAFWYPNIMSVNTHNWNSRYWCHIIGGKLSLACNNFWFDTNFDTLRTFFQGLHISYIFLGLWVKIERMIFFTGMHRKNTEKQGKNR